MSPTTERERAMSAPWRTGAPAGGGGRGAAGPVEPASTVETPLAAPPPPRGGRW